MQIGEYTNAAGQVFPRRHSALYGGATRRQVLYIVWRLPVQNVRGLPAAAIAPSGTLNAKPGKPRKSGRYHDFRRADLVLTGITETYRVLLHVRGADPVHYSRDSGRSGIPDLYPLPGDA